MVSEQITRLLNAKADIKRALEDKGVEVGEDTKLDEYASLIDNELSSDGIISSLKESEYSDRAVFLLKCAVKRVTIPEGTTSIPSSEFQGSSIESVVIPHTVTKLADYQFLNSKLKLMVLPNSIQLTGKAVFSGCLQLLSVVFEEPTQIDTLNNDLFLTAVALELVTIPRTVKIISDLVFRGTAIKSIVIPNTVTSLGYCVFSDCKDLESVVFEEGILLLLLPRYAFSKNYSLRSIAIPNSVVEVRDYAISGCTSLTSIELPASVTTIGNYVFSGCTSLTSIELPASVTTIGEAAININSRYTVTSYAITPPTLGKNAINADVNKCYAIYVPAESVDAYKTADGWSTYANRIQAIPE